MRAPGIVLLALALALSPSAPAATLAGVDLADSVSVGGKSLVLNGMGLREKYMIDIYVGALYLPAKTKSADQAIQQDVPKRISMHFIYKEVTKDQMVETFQEGLAKNPDAAKVADRFQQLQGMMATVKSGDVVVLDYVPGTGTTVLFNGKSKGTIPGADFMQAVWRIYLGPQPASTDLKKGMLGG